MTQYVKMNTRTGAVLRNEIRNEAPTIMEKGDHRWLAIYEGTLAGPWERFTALPENVSLGTTTITLNKEAQSLAVWKAKRITNLRTAAGSLINDEAPQHLQLNLIARATELTHKSTTTALSPSEQSEIESFQSLWTSKINPIRQACNDAEESISAATTHEAVESVYSSIVWP